MSLKSDEINKVYRLGWGKGWSVRRIARELKLDRSTVKKYLHTPSPAPVKRSRPSKLDPYREAVQDMIRNDPKVTAAVILQQLRPLGYTGGRSILSDYLKTIRPVKHQRAYVRIEVMAGERFEVDWGHFGSMDYDGDRRKLYAFAMVECHSRKLFVEFTHSRNFETFIQCHVHAFRYFGGICREIAYDNLLSVVAERDGNLIRFNPRFLAFAREMKFYPRACRVGAAWEKGTVERIIRYIRQSFWPLRQFASLGDVNRQVRQWLAEVANQRIHQGTRQKPAERFEPDALRPLPDMLPDYRETIQRLAHKDMRLNFDGNRYCVPYRLAGAALTLKADSGTVTIYNRNREVVTYPRCWQRGQDIGADRFEPELLQHLPLARRSKAQQRLIALLGPECPPYLRGIADNTDRSLSRQISRLLDLIRNYGPDAVRAALILAHQHRAFGAEYIANILRQKHVPRSVQPPLRLKDARLHDLVPDPLSMLDYDAVVLKNGREGNDDPEK